jgi:hypothetical protein
MDPESMPYENNIPRPLASREAGSGVVDWKAGFIPRISLQKIYYY